MTDARRPLGRILTFYSYKGGTGRSMAMANIAWILASAGRTVLMIDWDLEAPGLHRYFRPFLLDEELTASNGLIDLVDRYATAAIQPVDPANPPKPDWWIEYADFSDYVLSIDYDYFGSSGRLDFLPAGRQGDAYGLKVSSFNWQNLYDRLGGGAFFEAFKRRARQEYDYVLIDSRTGVSDTAGICSVQMPDTLVVCFTYNNQSIKGAAGVAQWARSRQDQLVQEMRTGAIAAAAATSAIEDSPRPYRIFPVPMRVDAGESDRLALRQAFARAAFRPMIGHLGADLADYWSQVEVPHNVFYAYEEVLAAFKDKPSDPKTVLSAFVRMTSYITDRDVTDYRLSLAPEEQQRFLETFAVTALPAAAKSASSGPVETEDEVLVRTAEAAFASLSDEQRAIAQRVFGRLVRIGRDEEGGGVSPIRAAIADFNDAERSVIAVLEKHGVLSVLTTAQTSTPTRAVAGQTVGFANDQLLRLSKTIIGWIESDREFLLWRQQLRTYVGDWERSDRKAPAVLGGTLFSEASYWYERRKSDLNKAETDFIWQASVTLQEEIEAPSRATFKTRRPAAPELASPQRMAPPSPPATPAAAPAARSGFPRWLGLGAAAALAVVIVVAGWLFGARSGPDAVQPVGTTRAAVIAAAAASSDPLQRALLLLELGPDADPPANAKDLAIDLATTTMPWAVLPNDAHPITVGRFGMDGKSFATGSSDGTVRVWMAGKPLVTFATNAGGAVSVALDTKSRRLLATGGNHIAEVWDLETQRVVNRLPIASNLLDGTIVAGRPILVQAAGSEPDAPLFLALFTGERAEKIQDDDVTLLTKLPPDTTAVRFSTSGEWSVAATRRSLEIWQLPQGLHLGSFIVGSLPRSLAISPNGAYLAVSTREAFSVTSVTRGSLGISLFPRLSVRERFSNERGDAGAEPPMAVSPDGQVVVFTYADGSACLAAAGMNIQIPFSRTSGLFAGTTGLTCFRGHVGAIVDVDFSIDGSLISTSGADGTSRLWRNPIGRPAPVRPPSSSTWGELWKTLRDRTTACLSADERMRLLNEPEARAREAAAKCDADYGVKAFAAPVPAS